MNQPAPTAEKPQQAAANAMSMLQTLVHEQNYKALGFESLQEVRQAQLGMPFEVYNMGVERLKTYRAGADPNDLLTPSEESMYPVMVDGKVRTGLTIIHKEPGYEASRFGDAEVMKRLAAYRQGEKEFAVRIPSLNMYFVGRRLLGNILLVPITDDPRLKAQAGEAVPLQAVVEQLRPYVKLY